MEGLDLLAGFLTGLASSAHCVGVCSGVSFALLTPTSRSTTARWSSAVGIHGGRMLGYTIGGSLVGLSGGGLGALLNLAGLNPVMRWLAAGVLVWTGLSIVGFAPTPRLADRWLPRLRPMPFIGGEGRLRPLLAGLGWSLMPCGMVYLALFNASLTGSPLRGAAYMAAFALGTMPALGAAWWAAFAMLKSSGGRAPQPRRRLALGLVLVALAPLSLLAASPDFYRTLCKGS
jgi:sulfite exporter TauE/SafE